MKTPKRPVALMTLAQALCLLALPVTLFVFITPAAMLLHYFQNAGVLAYDSSLSVDLSGAFLVARDLVVGLALICVEMEALTIFGRMKKTSAFSEKNEAALGRIAKALVLAGAVTLLFGDSVVPYLLTGLPSISPVVQRLLMPFTLLTLAAMVRTVQVLMRRALNMQEENDLTV